LSRKPTENRKIEKPHEKNNKTRKNNNVDKKTIIYSKLTIMINNSKSIKSA